MERLTLTQARERVAAQTPAPPEAHAIDWTRPGLDAVIIASMLPGAGSHDERCAMLAIAHTLLGYQAHLDYAAGQDAIADQWSAHLRAERAARKKAALTIHWIHAGHGWHVARLGRKYIAKCRVNGIFGTLEIRDARSRFDTVIAALAAPGGMEDASRKVRAWLRKQGR